MDNLEQINIVYLISKQFDCLLTLFTWDHANPHPRTLSHQLRSKEHLEVYIVTGVPTRLPEMVLDRHSSN